MESAFRDLGSIPKLVNLVPALWLISYLVEKRVLESFLKKIILSHHQAHSVVLGGKKLVKKKKKKKKKKKTSSSIDKNRSD